MVADILWQRSKLEKYIMNNPVVASGPERNSPVTQSQERVNLDVALQFQQIGDRALPEFLNDVRRDRQSQSSSYFTTALGLDNSRKEELKDFLVDQATIQNAIRDLSPEEALSVAQGLYRATVDRHGKDCDASACIAGWVANAAENAGNTELAAEMNTEAARANAAVFGPLHPTVLHYSNKAGTNYLHLAESAESPEQRENFLRQAEDRLKAVELYHSTRGGSPSQFADHLKTLETLIEVSELLEDEEAKQRYRREHERLLKTQQAPEAELKENQS